MIHLSDRQVEDYRRRALSPRELLAVDDHMATCPECRMWLAEGEPLSGSLAAWAELGKGDAPPVSRSVPGPPPGLRRGWVFVAAAALLAAVGLAIVLKGWGSRPGAGLEAGLESLPAAQRQVVAAALHTGRLDPPPEIADLAGPGSVLRGSSAPLPELVLLAPLATAVPGGRPVFRWTRLPQSPQSPAALYQVKVFDASLKPVAGSDPVPGTEWRPNEPLPPGVFNWQVVARRGGEERTAPDPGSPPARFRVLTADRARAVESDAQAAGGSHLARGVFYARGGLVDEAERELAQVVAANPGSAAARGLLASVRSWRPGPPQPPSPTITNGAQ